MKPVIYQKQVEKIKDKITSLKNKLQAETERADTIQHAVSRYVEEEASLRRQLENLGNAIVKNKEDYDLRLRAQQRLIDGVVYKYKNDVETLQEAYRKLKIYAEEECKILPPIIEKFKEQQKKD